MSGKGSCCPPPVAGRVPPPRAAGASLSDTADALTAAGFPVWDTDAENSQVLLSVCAGDDGKWLFGRKHGSGVYAFASGAKFEGKWDMGKMVGIGWFTAADGTRNIVDLRKKKDGGA